MAAAGVSAGFGVDMMRPDATETERAGLLVTVPDQGAARRAKDPESA